MNIIKDWQSWWLSRSLTPAWECSRDAPRLAPQRGAKSFPGGAWERENALRGNEKYLIIYTHLPCQAYKPYSIGVI
ncbi:MAG: hypothetical protein Q8N30_16480 [Methylococcales bacterium]|nr:hypothetical protein [Methylococcales bacterium]